MKTVDFEQLMSLTLQGDKKAYATLLNACMPLIYQIIRSKISDISQQEDIAQEILISIHQAKHTFEEGKVFKPWLYAICRFRVADALRKTYKTKGDISTDDLQTDIADTKENVTKQVEDNELVNKMMADLPEKQRNILLLMKVQGLTASEVAVKLDMSLSAVKVTAHRAVKKLHKKWGENDV